MNKQNELEVILERSKQRHINHINAVKFGLFATPEDWWTLLERSEKESNEDIEQINQIIGK